MKAAVLRRTIPFNPVAATGRPQAERPELNALSTADARKLLDAAREDPLWALFALAVTTGMRKGELFALRWGDVDLKRGQVSIRRAQRRTADGKYEDGPTKTKKSRRDVALGSLAIEALTAQRARVAAGLGAVPHGTVRVFGAPEGGALQPGNFRNRVWFPLLERAKLAPITFHAATRHTMATLALEMGVHPKVVQERLGHAEIGTTLDVYSHVSPELQRRAAEDIDSLLKAPGDSRF